jgi:4-alpha-methyl-delta7-sterol-4alpha-methyl oxidase
MNGVKFMTEWLQTWLSLYLDPMFWKLPVMTLTLSLLAFLLFALPWTWLAWRDPVWARRFKVQQQPFSVRSTLPATLQRIAFNTLVVAAILTLAWPVLRLSGIHDGALPHWSTYAWQLTFFVLLDDFLYYWMHRLMHENKWLLKHVHSVHHQIRTPSAIAGNHFHWLELAMTAGLALVGPVLLESHITVVYAWIILRQLEAADGHTGYNLPWDPLHWLPLYEGAAYHDFHHARFKGNYAGFLPVWDRVFDTYAKGYLEYRAACGKPPGLTPAPSEPVSKEPGSVTETSSPPHSLASRTSPPP